MDYRRFDLSPYEGCSYKLAKYGIYSVNWYEVPVHGDVNLRNPGKLAWVVEDSIIVDHRAVFHTKEEAFECGEDWEKERNDLNWTVTICHVEIPVYSSDEED